MFSKAARQLEEEANRVLSVVSEFLPMNTLFVAINDEHTNYIATAINRKDNLIKPGTELPFTQSYCYWVAKERNYIQIINTEKDDRTRNLSATFSLGATTFVGVPIILRGGRVAGTICGLDTQPFYLTSPQRDLLEAIASLLANVVELEHAAYRDPLTGIGNRRLLNDFLEHPVMDGNPKAVIFWDIDNLKPINDTWGHRAGDQAIELVVGHIMHRLPETHLFCRMGGDEFVAFLPSCDASEAVAIADDTLKTLQKRDAAHSSTNPAVDVTAGVATAATAHTWRRLLQEADTAMYQGKQKGGSQIVHKIL